MPTQTRFVPTPGQEASADRRSTGTTSRRCGGGPEWGGPLPALSIGSSGARTRGSGRKDDGPATGCPDAKPRSGMGAAVAGCDRAADRQWS
jgi:hypothetical protein